MKVIFYGDSITDAGRNYQIDFDPEHYGHGYVKYAMETLMAEDPEKYVLYNRGISGNRIVDLYARIKSDVWNHEPDVLSILIGINDIWHELSYKNGVELERFEKIYRMLIEDTLKRLPNLKIMLLEPFVLQGTAVDAYGIDSFNQVKEYAKVIKKLAEEYCLTFIPLQEKFDRAAELYGSSYLLYDGVHPDVAGATLIANEWLNAFSKL